jgi:hypothetical protein
MINEINIIIDTIPYIPDTLINDKIYSSSDKITSNKNIPVTSTIFIFNLNSDSSYSIYNDPNYMLYGIETPSNTYNLPSLFFFTYPPEITSNLYTVISTTVDNNVKNLLNNIGYNSSEISTISYQLLDAKDYYTNTTNKVVFLYFDAVPPTNKINNVYYNNQQWNVLIYPYSTNFENNNAIDTIRSNINLQNTLQNTYLFFANSITSIQNNNLYFDNRDIIKYTNKIDYKYIESGTDSTNNMEKVTLFSKSLKNYEQFFNSCKNKENTIMISLNEINKIENLDIDNETVVEKNYSHALVINKYINNNTTFSNVQKKFSSTVDAKFSFLKHQITNPEKFKYACYNYNSINKNLAINYFINTCIDVNNLSFYITNLYLYRILLLINPSILNNYYNNASDTITIVPLNSNSTTLEFDTGPNCFNLKLSSDSTFVTNSYYIENYRITYNTTYIIVLSIAYFNSSTVNFLDIDAGFVNYTVMDNTFSLAPNLYTISDSISIWNNPFSINLLDAKNYFTIINYDKISQYTSNNNTLLNHFYYFVPYLKNTNNFSNLYDLVSVNKLIENLINISTNFPNIKNNIYKNMSVTLLSIIYDTNITSIITDYSYFLTESQNAATVNGLTLLPYGYYKVFYYKNTVISKTNIETVNSIPLFLENNFCLMILMPTDLNTDSDFYNKNNQSYVNSTYSYNIGCNRTRIFLVLCDESNTIVYSDSQYIIGYELFNYTNNNNKIILNLVINNYLNFYQINIFTELYNNYNEQNMLTLDVDNLILNLHNGTYFNEVNYYNFQRFNYPLPANTTMNDITSQYNSSSTTTIINTLYNNKYNLSYFKINIKRLIFVTNTLKIIELTRKIICYLVQIINLIPNNNSSTNPAISTSTMNELVKYNLNTCLNLIIANYNLNITYGNCNTNVRTFYTSLLLKISDITIENCNIYIKNSNTNSTIVTITIHS